MGTCEHCGAELVKPLIGRPPTRFCSRKCKERTRTAVKRAALQAARISRACAECRGLIPESLNGRAVTCSRECGVRYQNRRRQEGKRAAWLASKLPCGRCGGEIPETRPANSLYCSPECKKKEMDARWRARTPGYQRERNYGVTPERYVEMQAEQDGRCAICGVDQPGGKGAWHVDHCHDSNKIRGLLCHHCNVGLGHFKDDPVRLRAAAVYLEQHST